jgi:hypothetical protein
LISRPTARAGRGDALNEPFSVPAQKTAAEPAVAKRRPTMTENNQFQSGPATPQPFPASQDNGVAAPGSGAAPATGQLRERAGAAWQAARDRAGDALHSGEVIARENPFPVVLGALAIGLAVGLACGPGKPPTWKERYVDEPIDHTQSAIFGALLAVAAAFRGLFRSAADCTEETAKSVRKGAKPLAKAAKRAGRKLHLN